MIKEKLRLVLAILSLLTVFLFWWSVALGSYLYFGVPMNMEPFIVDYSTGEPVLREVESPHPYPINWTDRLVLKVPYAELRIEKLVLESGDILVVENLATGDRWFWAGNGTGLLTKTFYAGSSGLLELAIAILDDGDGRTSWGLVIRTYVTDIWPLRVRPYLLIVILPVALPAIPAWALAAFIQAFSIALLLASWAGSGGFHHKVACGWREPFLKSFGNPLFALPFISTATLTGTVALTWLLEAVGIGAGMAGGLPGPLTTLMEASYAALVEELGFRLMLIGIPLALAACVKTRGGRPRAEIILKALLWPGALDEELRRSLKTAMAGLVLFSSVVFGLAHILFGAWEVGKAITATLAGLVMALCFVKYGLHASMLVHWFFNYHIQVWPVAYQLLGPPYDLLDALVTLYELGLGALSLLLFFIQGIRMAMRRART